MSASNREEARQALEGGLIAGLVGGLLLSILMMVGHGVWPALKGAAYPFYGEATQDPGFALGPVLLGVAIHFAVSLFWGGLFGLVFYGISRPGTVMVSALYGLVVWIVMNYAVLQIAGMGDMVRSVPPGVAALTHVVFGLAVGISFLPFQRPGHGPIRRPLPAGT